MNNQLRERTILPVLIPLVAIIVTEVIVFSLSRVLLASGEKLAVVIALGMALAILVGAAAIAGARRSRTSSIIGLLAVVGIGVVAAGAVAMQRGPAYVREAAANRPTIEVTAKNLAFSTDTLKLSPMGTMIKFTNADTQPHNIAIYKSAEALNDPLFRGQILQPGQAGNYEVGELKAGTYHFHCDVHPNMSGVAVVEEASGTKMSGGHESHSAAHG